MRVIVGFMFLLGVVLSLILLKFELSVTTEAVMLSLIVGIVVFILVSGLVYSGSNSSKNKNRNIEEQERKRKRRANTIGIIFMVVAMAFFFNFYFYFKALVGNDLLVSLDVNDENFVMKNREEMQINVKARVLTNPFCKANCSLVLKDLSNDEILSYDNISIKFSSPLSREYTISSNEEKAGQKLYKVTLDCNTIKERFCYSTSPSPALRTKIISVDYEPNDAEKIIERNLKNNTEILNREFYTMQNILNSMDFDISVLDLSDLEEKQNSINKSLYSLSPAIDNLNNLYLNQEYYRLGTEIYAVSGEIIGLTNLVNELNSSFFNNITAYNSLIDNISLMHEEILYLEEYNFSDSSLLIAETFIEDFNLLVLNMKKEDTLDNRIVMFNQVETERDNLLSVLENESNNNISGENILGISISSVNIQKISVEQEDYTSYFTLDEPSPICCLNKKCYDCIDDSSLNYPVVFVHGHSFNEKLSPELSMDSFGEMAGELEKEGGYLDAGYFYRSQYDESSKAYLGKVNSTILVEATYYIDTMVTEEGSFILNSKWESIDTYALRLNEIISNVKYITGKDKVIVVAHSMGGLVTRRYIQLYGEESIDRIVLIGIPNKGVDGFVLNYCAVFGADIECSEMNESSSFLEELNNAPLPNIPIYNIVGLGCFTEGSPGDGIVKNESAYLEGAENIFVNGTCSGVDFFHVRMVYPSLHPDIYEIVKNSIEK